MPIITPKPSYHPVTLHIQTAIIQVIIWAIIRALHYTYHPSYHPVYHPVLYILYIYHPNYHPIIIQFLQMTHLLIPTPATPVPRTEVRVRTETGLEKIKYLFCEVRYIQLCRWYHKINATSVFISLLAMIFIFGFANKYLQETNLEHFENPWIKNFRDHFFSN